MKELNTFRKFLAEGSSKLMSQGEYWVKNNDLGPKTTTADIEKWVSDNFEKYAKPGDDKAKIIADLAAYNDGLNKFLNEGTWGYGSKNQMLKALDKLNKIGQMGGVKGSVELSKIDDMLYNVFGNDDFHDSIDQAKDNAIDDDRFANYIGDAQAKGMKMLNDIYSDKGANAFTKAADNPDVVGRDMMAEERNTFEITPEYLFDAAIQYIQDDYDGASLHVAPDGTTDDFFDGDKHVHTIKSKEQAEAIIDNFEAQMVKTAQNDLEENDRALDEIIGESKEDLTKSILKKHPKKYKDEKAVTAAAAKLMKDPKFKARYKGKKGVDFIIHTLKTLERGK